MLEFAKYIRGGFWSFLFIFFIPSLLVCYFYPKFLSASIAEITEEMYYEVNELYMNDSDMRPVMRPIIEKFISNDGKITYEEYNFIFCDRNKKKLEKNISSEKDYRNWLNKKDKK